MNKIDQKLSRNKLEYYLTSFEIDQPRRMIVYSVHLEPFFNDVKIDTCWSFLSGSGLFTDNCHCDIEKHKIVYVKCSTPYVKHDEL